MAASGASGFDPLPSRRAGVLLHPTSLPGGVLGADAYRFVDWLSSAGIGVWQCLPVGPPGADGSPYQCDSAYAGNPALVCVDALKEEGLPCSDDGAHGWAGRFAGACRPGGRLADAYADFVAASAAWLEDYARYRVAKAHHGNLPWWDWPGPLRHREGAALAALDRDHGAGLEAVRVEQFFFARQWRALRRHADARGVALFGDMPIFVAHDSADVWCRPDLFLLDAEGGLVEVAGVPPDYFSATGQRWGNPLYRWDRLAAEGFRWWSDRLRHELARFDLLRIDHFRGFQAFWSIPAACPTAVEGRWVEAPGDALFARLVAEFGGLPLVAEDLGTITPEVVALREKYGLPGMRVLQFAFDGGADNPYLPCNHTVDSVVYTGTHDNDTTLGWWRGLDAGRQARVLDVLGQPGEAMPRPLVRAALASVARLAVIPMQDLLGLDGTQRMNTPATTEGNWRWRFSWSQVPDGLAEETRNLCALYGRT